MIFSLRTPLTSRLLTAPDLDDALADHDDAPIGARVTDAVGITVAVRVGLEVIGDGMVPAWAMEE